MISKTIKRVSPVKKVFKSRKIKIKVVGLGGGGTSIVSEIAKNLNNVNFLAADTDARLFKKAQRKVKVFQFGEKLAGGMGTGMNPELAEKAAREEQDKIAKIFQGHDISIIIGCLGGGVASGAGPVFAEVAKSQKNISLGIFTLPFGFEGEKKMHIAKKALEKLKENLSGITVIPNERIFRLIDKKTPLKKALSSLNKVFADWLGDLINLILRPALINIDFADLKTILKGRGNLLFFGRGVAAGVNRAEEVLKQIFQNPLFDGQPKNIKRILFNITGGKDLKIKEVELLSETIFKLNERAKIIFGISELPKNRGEIKMTLLVVGTMMARSAERPRSSIVSSKKETGQQKGLNKKSKMGKAGARDKTKSLQKEKSISLKSKKEKTRRSALEIKKAEKAEEEREWAQEPDWQIPAFLREKNGRKKLGV